LLRLKGPKKEIHKRTITIDDDLFALLVAERDRHLRIVAGIPDGAPVDLSLVKLPADALMFPTPPESGEGFSFTRLRNPRNTTKEFVRKAALSASPIYNSRICAAPMKRTCLTGGCRRPPSPRAAVMIRP
jgi:hypothetical protein